MHQYTSLLQAKYSISAVPAARPRSSRYLRAVIFPFLGDYHLCLTLCLCYDRCLTYLLRSDEQPPFPSLGYRATQAALPQRPELLPGALGAPVQASRAACAGTGSLYPSPREPKREPPRLQPVLAQLTLLKKTTLPKPILHHSRVTEKERHLVLSGEDGGQV